MKNVGAQAVFSLILQVTGIESKRADGIKKVNKWLRVHFFVVSQTGLQLLMPWN